jgi:hypothetical protein
MVRLLTEFALVNFNGLIRTTNLIRAALHKDEHGFPAEHAPVCDSVITEAMFVFDLVGWFAAQNAAPRKHRNQTQHLEQNNQNYRHQITASTLYILSTKEETPEKHHNCHAPNPHKQSTKHAFAQSTPCLHEHHNYSRITSKCTKSQARVCNHNNHVITE